MTWLEALDHLETGSENGIVRFRELCDEANDDPYQRDAYRALMIRKATGQPEPQPPPTPSTPPAEISPAPASHIPVAESIRATQLGFKQCWFSEGGCGCNGVQCHLLKRIVNLHDCVSCLRRW